MEVKEAIEWLFDIWHEWENVYGVDTEEVLIEGKKYDEVVALLKQGEAYRQMWGWLDNTISAYYGDPKYFREYSTKQIIKIMSELEQKYLKEANPNEAGKAKDNRK